MNNPQNIDIKENNERFWLRMTKLGTLQYCHEMLKLSVEFQGKRDIETPFDKHLESLDEAILKYMDYVVEQTNNKTWDSITPEESPFPSDLHGYIHDYSETRRFQPNHLMCKLAALRDETNKLVYEFLIEYDIFETDVEIYFGVKAIHDTWMTTPEFQEIALKHWEEVKKEGAYKRKLYRFKMTNNGNNGTFWPFWWRMGMDCKEELSDAVDYLTKFYNDYKETLNLQDVFAPKFDIIKNEVENSLRSTKDYEILTECIERDFSPEVNDHFETLIERCLEEKIIRRLNTGELMYACIGTATKFLCILKVFFISMSWKYCEGKRKAYTPNKLLQKVFLNKNGRAIGDKSWGVTAESAYTSWSEAVELLKGWFPEIEIKGKRAREK